jgi:lysyl-tRNA synthetase class 1
MTDEYERFERVYYGIDSADEAKTELSKLLYPLSEPGPVAVKYVPKLPFKFAVMMCQLEEILGNATVVARCEEALKRQYGLSKVPKAAQSLILSRLKLAKNWVTDYGSENDKIQVPPAVPDEVRSSLTEQDRNFLSEFVVRLRSGSLSDEEIQATIFQTARDAGVTEKHAFLVLYRILVSQKYGPRIGPFVNTLGAHWVATRIESVL